MKTRFLFHENKYLSSLRLEFRKTQEYVFEKNELMYFAFS